jgi:Zonular occludens toxin (Zot)
MIDHRAIEQLLAKDAASRRVVAGTIAKIISEANSDSKAADLENHQRRMAGLAYRIVGNVESAMSQVDAAGGGRGPTVIVLVTGPPGSGKSFYAVRKVAQALSDGKPVATNVRLVDGWTERMAKRDLVRRAKPFATGRFRRQAPARYFFSEDLDELMRVRLHGRGESRGVMVWDEAHNWMNARAWTAEEARGASEPPQLELEVGRV